MDQGKNLFLEIDTNKKWFLKLGVLFTAVYFFSLNGLAALPSLSLQFLLKNQMKLGASQMAYFQAIVLIAWVIKPLWGYISDTFPILGSRRKSYLVMSSILAALSWIVLALFYSHYELLLAIISICYMAYAFQDVVTDGLMIEMGKPYNLTGQFQAIQWASVYIAMILTAFCGGYLSDLTQTGRLSYRFVFASTAVFPLLTLLIVGICAPKETNKAAEAGRELRVLFKQKNLWILSLFLFFWNFSPSFGTPFFYYSVDTLKFNGSFLGLLQGIASAAALLGSIIYGKYFVRISTRSFLIFAIFAGIAAILLNFIFFIPFVITHALLLRVISAALSFLFGILNTWIFLTLLNLAAKVSPQYAGGTGFAFLMSIYNLGLMGSSAFGGFLFPRLGLKPLILISALFSLFSLLFLPYLPISEKLTALELRIKSVLEKGA